MSKKFLVTLPEDLHTALKEESKKSGVRMAEISRRLIALHLESLGYEVTSIMSWGGVRETSKG